MRWHAAGFTVASTRWRDAQGQEDRDPGAGQHRSIPARPRGCRKPASIRARDLDWSTGHGLSRHRSSSMGAGPGRRRQHSGAARLTWSNATMSARSSCAGSDIEPNAQLACWAMSSDFLAKEQVRGNALRHGAHPCGAVVQQGRGRRRTPRSSRSSRTRPRSRPRLVEKAAPRWTWYDRERHAECRRPVMAQFEFWTRR